MPRHLTRSDNSWRGRFSLEAAIARFFLLAGNRNREILRANDGAVRGSLPEGVRSKPLEARKKTTSLGRATVSPLRSRGPQKMPATRAGCRHVQAMVRYCGPNIHWQVLGRANAPVAVMVPVVVPAVPIAAATVVPTVTASKKPVKVGLPFAPG